MSNKIYPIGIQNFEKIRKDGYLYIDTVRDTGFLCHDKTVYSSLF